MSLPNVGQVAMSNLRTDIFFSQRRMCYPKNVRSTRSGVRYVPLYDCCSLSAFCEATPRASIKNIWALSWLLNIPKVSIGCIAFDSINLEAERS